MDRKKDPLEKLWDELLSGEKPRIAKAFYTLDEHSQRSVLTHLRRMVNEDGWQTEQRLSAEAALRALEEFSESG